MSDSLLSLLADELDTSPQKAKKLLIAMLREVKKRARREGVRLPNFGTFREADGQITFEPSPSLARAVNHRFEGLESEDLGSAPGQAADEESEDDEGPNTITLGYQESDWAPLDSEDEAADTQDEEEADTEEFQVPEAEETADTEEIQSPTPTASSSPDDATGSASPSDASSETTETEELYPLVDDVPDSSPADETADAASDPPDTASPAEMKDEEHDSLSGIWDDEDEPSESTEDTGFDPFSSEPDDETATTSEQTEAEPSPAAPSSAPDSPSEAPAPDSSDREASPADRDPEPPESSKAEEGPSRGSVGARVGVGVLVVLLLGGAAWYLLGRRGTVQPPRQTFAQLKAQVEPQVEALSAQAQNLSTDDLPLVGGSSSTASDADLGSPPSATAEVGAGSGSGADSGTPTDGVSSETDASTSGDRGSPPALSPSAGGWTIVVASRTQRGPAESLVQKYRTTFADQNLAIGILTSEVDNQTRYRVGVGQFDSRTDAQRLLDEAGAKLPQGAWPLRLQ